MNSTMSETIFVPSSAWKMTYYQPFSILPEHQNTDLQLYKDSLGWEFARMLIDYHLGWNDAIDEMQRRLLVREAKATLPPQPQPRTEMEDSDVQ